MNCELINNHVIFDNKIISVGGSKLLKDKLAAPILKWVGGKRQILNEITKHVPGNFKFYYEPFTWKRHL